MTKNFVLISLKFMIPDLPKDMNGKSISIVLRSVLEELRAVKPLSLQRLADEDPDWILWTDDLTDEVDMKKFCKVSEAWLDGVWAKKIPATEQSARKYFAKSLVGVGSKKDAKPRIIINHLPHAKDSGPEKSDKIEDASWHYEGDFPPDLENDSAFTHIGFYLAWLCLNGLYSSDFIRTNSENVIRLFNREITPGEMAIGVDGKLYTAMFCRKAAEFSLFYYGEDNKYYGDLDSICAKLDLSSIYHFEDSWENYIKISKLIDKAFAKWENKKK